MFAPWLVYAGIVVLGATGIHAFSKLAQNSIDPIIALTYTMIAGLLVSLCFLPFANESIAKSFIQVKTIGLYALVGGCIAIAHLGIYWMFQAGAPISIATPLVRLSPAILAVAIGILFFRESFTLQNGLGLALVVLGFFFLTKE